MSKTTVTLAFRKNGTLTDADTSVKLSDPDGDYGVKRNDTDAVVVADGTSMTHTGTGLYQYTFTDLAANLEYTAYFEIVHGGGTHRSPKIIKGGGAATSGTAWTPTTLTAQILGELNQDRNATGGAVPDRLKNIVYECYRRIWVAHPFPFRKRRAELTLTASTDTIALASDFEKLDQKWLEETSNYRKLRFTNDPQRFDSWRQLRSGAEGEPFVALIEADESGGFQARVAPTPVSARTYIYYYICIPPDLATTSSPTWVQTPFDDIWHQFALARAMRQLDRDSNWQEPYSAYKSAIAKAIEEHSETMVSDTPTINDGYGDLQALASTQFGFGRIF